MSNIDNILQFLIKYFWDEYKNKQDVVSLCQDEVNLCTDCSIIKVKLAHFFILSSNNMNNLTCRNCKRIFYFAASVEVFESIYAREEVYNFIDKNIKIGREYAFSQLANVLYLNIDNDNRHYDRCIDYLCKQVSLNFPWELIK